MLRLCQALFWIVAVSFIVQSGLLPAPAAQRIPESAHQSAAAVVGAVENLPALCRTHAQACALGSDVLSWGANAIGAAAGDVAQALGGDPSRH